MSYRNHPPSYTYHLAQQLNNSAAQCIEIGHYSRAIWSLSKALEINRNQMNTDRPRREKVCKCYRCTLDGCIAFSESNRSAAAIFDCTSSNGECPNIKKRRIDSSEVATEKRNLCDSSSSTISQESEDRVFEDGYTYCQPILVGSEGHTMGATLFLVIIFNLALAYHLKALDGHHTKKERDTIIQKTLSMYELSHWWQLKLLSKDKKGNSTSSTRAAASYSSVASIRFNMIIQNNLSQIYLLINDNSKYKRCLQQLLSTVMVVLDYKTTSTNNTDASRITSEDPRVIEIEGFLTNTTALILGDGHCAQAA